MPKNTTPTQKQCKNCFFGCHLKAGRSVYQCKNTVSIYYRKIVKGKRTCFKWEAIPTVRTAPAAEIPAPPIDVLPANIDTQICPDCQGTMIRRDTVKKRGRQLGVWYCLNCGLSSNSDD